MVIVPSKRQVQVPALLRAYSLGWTGARTAIVTSVFGVAEQQVVNVTVYLDVVNDGSRLGVEPVTFGRVRVYDLDVSDEEITAFLRDHETKPRKRFTEWPMVICCWPRPVAA